MKKLLMMLVVMTLLFICSSQPMVMVVGLILVTLFYSMMVYSFMGTFWFSYVFLLVMMSAVLVIFTYMASLSPNESFEMVSFVFITVLMVLLVNKGEWFWNVSGDLLSLNLWMKFMLNYNLYLVSFLLGIMVLVVWLTYDRGKAVRGF